MTLASKLGKIQQNFQNSKTNCHSEALAEESPTNRYNGYFASAQYDENINKLRKEV